MVVDRPSSTFPPMVLLTVCLMVVVFSFIVGGYFAGR
jgi:hypothetical protein